MFIGRDRLLGDDRRRRGRPSASCAATRSRCCRSAATTWPTTGATGSRSARPPTPAKLPQDLPGQLVPQGRRRQVPLAGLRREQPRARLDHRPARRRRRRPWRPRSASRRPRVRSYLDGLDLTEEQLTELFAVDPDRWLAECDPHRGVLRAVRRCRPGRHVRPARGPARAPRGTPRPERTARPRPPGAAKAPGGRASPAGLSEGSDPPCRAEVPALAGGLRVGWEDQGMDDCCTGPSWARLPAGGRLHRCRARLADRPGRRPQGRPSRRAASASACPVG